MWKIKLLILSLMLTLNCLADDKSNVNEIGNSEGKCYYVPADHNNISKLKKYFQFKFDNIENQGIYFYILLSKDSISFEFKSNNEKIRLKTEKLDENTYFIPDKNIYIGTKIFPGTKDENIWLSNYKLNLFKNENSYGLLVNNVLPCLDRKRINQIYEERKREVEFGPEPSGDF